MTEIAGGVVYINLPGKNNLIQIISIKKTTHPINQKQIKSNLSKNLEKAKKSETMLFIGVGGEISVFISTMNSIISVCEEYSDNVWYSEFDEYSMPTRIAIEIEKKYKYNFLKAVLRYGYILDGMRRKDENYTILQLKKSEKPIILSDLI